MLRRLVAPVEIGFARYDPFIPGYTSPMFNGCMDWHSAVHAAYSLYTLYGVTGDVSYLKAVEAKVKDESVPAELEYMRTAEYKGLPFGEVENPYGMAWFLDLAMKREEVTGNRSLRPIAEFAVQRIRELLDSLDPERMREQILVPAHYNLTWGVIHLHRWAEYTRDAELLSFIERKAVPALLDPELDAACPAQADSTEEFAEFFPPGLLRLAGVAQVWRVSPDVRAEWVGERVPADLHIDPVTNPDDPTGHKYAINFSRAYALWHIYRATRNVRFRDNYTELISYHLSRPDLWGTEAGYVVSHFVPQFGIRAISTALDDGAL
ncbi:DUF2891 family protein [Streptomyces sp. NPDC051985]|uniref:DUF2891 family protein n=1 Tax=Streptomyces sp. NPDC051985 TaxID=3155807 RepID=UPI003445E05B